MKQILVFVLFAALLCWCAFSPVYKHVLIMRQAVLQNEVDMLLEVGANGSHGYIDSAMIAESKERLKTRGFQVDLLQYEVDSTDGVRATDPNRPVPRGTGIRLTITYPLGRLLAIDRLVGAAEPDESARIGAFGVKMSEYVP